MAKEMRQISHRWTGALLFELECADLSRITLCGATIDGATLALGSVGGHGHILCALTAAEWDVIRNGRAK